MKSQETQQITDTIMMVRPSHFGYNEQTAADNAFQRKDDRLRPEEVQSRAAEEFDQMVSNLRDHGVRVLVFSDSDQPLKPDAVFPNNWISFHQGGTLITYPMFSTFRRQERRDDIIRQIESKYHISDHWRLEGHEVEDRFLEGTGSMVLDRPNRIAYACTSVRTDLEILEEFCRKMGYEHLAFRAVDRQGQEIYHTNVMMALGDRFVVICMESVEAEDKRQTLREKFAATGKEIIEITIDQMYAFAGNMLQVRNRKGDAFLVMSTQAYQSLRPEQIHQIEQFSTILHSPLDTIETFGGGSARCMMAEVFLPEKGVYGLTTQDL